VARYHFHCYKLDRKSFDHCPHLISRYNNGKKKITKKNQKRIKYLVNLVNWRCMLMTWSWASNLHNRRYIYNIYKKFKNICHRDGIDLPNLLAWISAFRSFPESGSTSKRPARLSSWKKLGFELKVQKGLALILSLSK